MSVTSDLNESGTTLVTFQSNISDLNSKQFDFAHQVEEFVNSGEYNISQCQTSYTMGYLTAARCNYYPRVGKGNSLRVNFIQSKYDSVTDKNTDALHQLSQFGDGAFSKVTIYWTGHLMTAEVWWFDLEASTIGKR